MLPSVRRCSDGPAAAETRGSRAELSEGLDACAGTIVYVASVIIAPFRRPRLLQAALASVLSQHNLASSIEVLVVDNDPGRSADRLVCDLVSSAPLPLRYVSEPRPGISHARNAGVAAAKGRYIVFLDDDEVAEPEWLSNLLSTARHYEADIVVGPVRPRYPDGAAVPRYAQQIYDKDARVPTGNPVRWTCIANALLLRERCLAAAAPFDPKLGLSGGEDSFLFGRLREQGRQCIWCAEAVVSETIPVEKLRPAYLLRRAFRGGQTTTYIPSALARPQWPAVLRWMIIGLGQVCIYGPVGLVLRLSGRKEWLSFMAKAASGLGKLLWHPALHIRNYQLKVTPRSASGAGW